MGWKHDAYVVVEFDIVILGSAVKTHVLAMSALKINHDVLCLVDWSLELHAVDLVHIDA